jgi:predicted  nucleic acid-binding Zn-ribbon protein
VVPFATGVVLLFLPGCATASDLDKLQQKMTADMTTALSQVRIQVRGLQDNLTAFETRTKNALDTEKKAFDEVEMQRLRLEDKVSAVNTKLAGEIGELKRDLDEFSFKGTRELETINVTVGGLRKQLDNVQQDVSAFQRSTQRFQSILANQSSQMQVLTRTLLRRYQLEVQALQGHMKEVEQAVHDLEPLATTAAANR